MQSCSARNKFPETKTKGIKEKAQAKPNGLWAPDSALSYMGPLPDGVLRFPIAAECLQQDVHSPGFADWVS